METPKLTMAINKLHLLGLFLLFALFSNRANAQLCGGSGCNTNYANFGYNSDNSPADIEYDNFASSFHSTVIRTGEGKFQVWGERTKANAVDHNFVPQEVNPTNFIGLTGTPLKITIGGAGNGSSQVVLLTTNGLFAWGSNRAVFSNAIKNTIAFGPVNMSGFGGQANGLPIGVSPNDVKVLTASAGTLGILTCGGEVWMLSQMSSSVGDGTTTTDNVWHRVTSNQTGFPVLNNIVSLRLTVGTAVALASDGKLWTWGLGTYDGSGAKVTSARAKMMVSPKPSATIKMIGLTTLGGAGVPSTPTAERFPTYYVLYTDGSLYALGHNHTGQLGNWNTTASTTWIQPRYDSAAGPAMNDIKWISPNEHSGFVAAINVLNNAGQIYNWGDQGLGMLGRASGSPAIANPGMPLGIGPTEKVLVVVTGGHTTMAVKLNEPRMGYTGHYTNGSAGNNDTTVGGGNYIFGLSFVDTPEIKVCGLETPLVQNIEGCSANLNAAIQSTNVTPSDAVIRWFNGSDPVTATQITNITAATPGTYYAFYYYVSTDSYSAASLPIAVTAVGIDSDGDGISDACDLDDDNDGILDTAECTVVSENLIAWFNGLNVYFPTVQPVATGFLTGDASVSGSGLSRTRDVVSAYQIIAQVAAANEAEAILNNEYVEYTLNVGSKPVVVNQIGYYRISSSADNTTYNFSLRVSDNNFLSSTVVHDSKAYVPVSATSDLFYNTNSPLYLRPNTTYVFRVYFHGVAGGTAANFVHDDFKLFGFAECDTDGDGIPNRLDLDSDNDGCPDAIEGASITITPANLVNSAMPGGNTGATSGTYNVPEVQNLGNTVNTASASASYGVPTIAGSGQAIGTAATANPLLVAGLATASQTIASGTAPSALLLSGANGTIQWQVSTDNVTFTNVSSGGTTATYAPGILNVTTYYRVLVTSAGGCTALSNVVIIAMFPDSDGDGLHDGLDWDDDNDGILDAVESPNCFYTSAEAHLIINVTSPFNGNTGDPTAGNPITTLHDLINPNTNPFNFAGQAITSGTAIFNISYPTTVLLTSLTVNQTANGMTPASRFGRLFGSNDGINFTLISSATAVALNTATVTFAVTSTTPYRYYQIRYVGTTAAGNSTSGTLGSANIQEFTAVYNTTVFVPSANPKPETCISDADSDGIANHLDLDSDGDGCADVIEGGASFAIGASYISGNRLNTTVNANGVPGVPAATTGYTQAAGQSVAQAQNQMKSDCLDSDGDGVPNWLDLDNDNDGILDTAEGYCASQTVYTMNMASTLASANASFNANGATFNLVYELTSGTAVAGLGSTFNVPFTYSDFNNTAGITDHRWEGFNASATRLHLRPVTAELYTGLPTNNSTQELFNVAQSPDWNFRNWLNTGALNKLGTFTSTIGNIPTLPGQVAAYSSSTPLQLYSTWNMPDNTNPSGGYYAKLQVQTAIESGFYISTLEYDAAYGQQYAWDYTAFNNNPSSNFPSNAGDRGLITITRNAITFCNHRDTDGDGTPDYLDLDSDDDGCADAREGDENVLPVHINAAGSIRTNAAGTANGNDIASVNANGVPLLVNAGGAADIGNDVGQTIGSSTDLLVNPCCTNLPTGGTPGTYTQTGISSLEGFGNGWPQNIPNGFMAIESKNKGFVITRVANTTAITAPVEGMLIYDLSVSCVKLFNGTSWNCIEKDCD